MELNFPAAPAALKPPPAETSAGKRPPATDASGEPFAQELAQWMGDGALPAGMAAEVADAAGEITAEVAATEEPAADPAAMIWMILGLQKPNAPIAHGASAEAPPAEVELAAAQALPTLPATAQGRRPELPAQAHHGRATSGPIMPTLPSTASPVASAALATAFARHLELAPGGDAAGLPLAPGLEGLPAAAVAGSAEVATTPAAPSALPAVSMVERVNSLTAGLTPAEVIDPLTPQAPQQIAETVVWHLGKGEQEVRIRMNPKDLGQIDVSIKLEGEHVDVRFDAADASVRDVVQTSLPQLASLLSARGLTLDQAQVFSQSRGYQNPATPESDRRSSAEGSSEIGTVTETRPVLRRGLVDDYV